MPNNLSDMLPSSPGKLRLSVGYIFVRFAQRQFYLSPIKMLIIRAVALSPNGIKIDQLDEILFKHGHSPDRTLRHVNQINSYVNYQLLIVEKNLIRLNAVFWLSREAIAEDEIRRLNEMLEASPFIATLNRKEQTDAD